MARSARPGVSVYLETFILVGVVVGGTALVYGTTAKYGAAVKGPSVTVSDVSIRQGVGVAVVQLVIGNSGTVAFSSFTVTVGGTLSASQYCLTLFNPATASAVQPYTGACAAPTGTTQGTVPVTPSSAVQPGQNLLTTITIYSKVFAPGSAYQVTVLTSSASEQVATAVASPA